MNHIQKYQLIKLAEQGHAPGSVGAFFQTDPIRQSPFPKSSKPPVQAELKPNFPPFDRSQLNKNSGPPVQAELEPNFPPFDRSQLNKNSGPPVQAELDDNKTRVQAELNPGPPIPLKGGTAGSGLTQKLRKLGW